MGTFLAILMPLMLFMGYPFMVILIGAVMLGVLLFLPGFDLTMVIQQTLTGMKPFSLVCIPMFILAANLITAGEAAKRLIRLIKAYIGHVTGGLPVTLNAGCTLFGAVSGSTQATLAAIGAPMRPMCLEAGYSDSWTIATTIAATDMAILIPPSIGFIVYGVATATSVGKLYLAGIGPGIILFLGYAGYAAIYSKVKKIKPLPKVSWAERWQATKQGVWLIGFPAIVIGGIYMGIFSPTEAAAASVIYALFVELVVYRSLTLKKILEALLSTGVVTAVVFLLVGAGQVFSFILSYMRIPQQIVPQLMGPDPSALRVIIIVNLVYLVACMFVDPIVAIFVLSPIFHPYVLRAGVDPVFMGVFVTLQVAIGSNTPPFGCDIFTAQLLYKKSYLTCVRNIFPFILISLAVNAILILVPEISMFLPNISFGK
jgi:tripartite ATP-independent transporter DctM subunit